MSSKTKTCITLHILMKKSKQTRSVTYTCKEMVDLFTKEGWETDVKKGLPLLSALKTFETVEAAKEGRKRLDAALRIINRRLPVDQYAIRVS